MNELFEYNQAAVISRECSLATVVTRLLTAIAILCIMSCSSVESTNVELKMDAELDQAIFATPGDAASTLSQSVKNGDDEMLFQILGDDYRKILPLDEVDADDLENYINAWEKSNTLLQQGEGKVLIAVGEDQWTFPIPITKVATGWYFDVQEGLERMRIRQVGRNELSTMQAVLAYYDAQMEYAEEDHNGDGILEYAQKFISTTGLQNGLFWEVEPGETLSPLGPLMADDSPDGGYHGYYYRILTSQGEFARGGAYDYLMGERMRAGFALIAWPVEYGETGIMSFVVSHSGIVYEQNLGPEGPEIAKNMTSYNPDASWSPVQEVTTILDPITQ